MIALAGLLVFVALLLWKDTYRSVRAWRSRTLYPGDDALSVELRRRTKVSAVGVVVCSAILITSLVAISITRLAGDAAAVRAILAIVLLLVQYPAWRALSPMPERDVQPRRRLLLSSYIFGCTLCSVALAASVMVAAVDRDSESIGIDDPAGRDDLW